MRSTLRRFLDLVSSIACVGFVSHWRGERLPYPRRQENKEERQQGWGSCGSCSQLLYIIMLKEVLCKLISYDIHKLVSGIELIHLP